MNSLKDSGNKEPMIIWEWKLFSELGLYELYEVMSLRQSVFAVQQRCAYLDADGRDLHGHHLLGWEEWDGKRTLIAYLRYLPAGVKYEERSIGRVVTAPSVRGQGVGLELVRIGLEKIESSFGPGSIRISAQSHLQRFYGKFGFVSLGEEYLEDNILHREMLLKRN